jgi:DNA-binding IclR family transcriptional regulator
MGSLVSSSFVKSAERTLDVLHLLASRLRPVPASVVAHECAIPRSSTYHLLNVLRDRGWVNYYEAERAWGLGLTAFETGSAYLRSEPLQRAGRPLLAALTEHTGDTAHLAILEGTDVLYIDKEESRTAPRLVTEIGVRLPAHLTAVGRAILSRLSPAQVRALYARPVLVRRRGPRLRRRGGQHDGRHLLHRRARHRPRRPADRLGGHHVRRGAAPGRRARRGRRAGRRDGQPPRRRAGAAAGGGLRTCFGIFLKQVL